MKTDLHHFAWAGLCHSEGLTSINVRSFSAVYGCIMHLNLVLQALMGGGPILSNTLV